MIDSKYYTYKVSVRYVGDNLHYRKNDGVITTIRDINKQKRFIRLLHHFSKLGNRRFVKVDDRYFCIVNR